MANNFSGSPYDGEPSVGDDHEHDDCSTCDDLGVLIGDKVDAFGERTDDLQPCPDCQVGMNMADLDTDEAEERYRFAFDYEDVADAHYQRSEAHATRRAA